ncbi:DNA polymerase delta subunit 3-like isoform X2 [Acanthaster planci]|uniref:DNA polymerase delta subunit 3 n=1 Tax=Acanthaster planci TaxID=133434 RepID=A0A8B7YRL7_ACAPL|nr:DNA polymerase delta subunit 3-like isoform X2 [Acanthaster planci]
MAGDMYLENLEEFLFDEDKVVTYRWLSQTLSVHVNQAKQMLETFVQHQESKANSQSINVTYLLSGIQNADNGVSINKVLVVADKDLEKTEASMTSVISKHVYSVQKAALKDSNSLYMTDYQIIKDNIKQPNRFSAIKCIEAKPRTTQELVELEAHSSYPVSDTSPQPKMNGSAEKHVIENLKQDSQRSVTNKAGKGRITSFGGFASGNNKVSSADTSCVMKEEQKQTLSSKAKGGMMAFLNRPSSAKPKKEDRSSPPSKPSTIHKAREVTKPADTQDKIRGMEKDVNTGGKVKRKAGKIEVSDSDSEEERQARKRRRRIIEQDSSSSSEDELSDMEDSPIPPTPPPDPVDMNPSSDSENKDITDRSSHAPGTKEPATTSPGSGKKRRRKRVLKNKTTVDADGCMVTEKVWESDWTDMSEDEAPPSKQMTPAPSQPSPKEGGAKRGGEEEGKQKKMSPGSGKAKQRSLMSFFKKK